MKYETVRVVKIKFFYRFRLILSDHNKTIDACLEFQKLIS